MENQLIMEFVASSEGGRQSKVGWQSASVQREKADIVGRQLECARDEIKCRKLMKSAKSGSVVIALDNLRRVLEAERKSISKP